MVEPVPTPEGERLVTVTAPSPEACAAGVDALLEALFSAPKPPTGLSLLVASQSVGAVIGKGGTSIAQVRGTCWGGEHWRGRGGLSKGDPPLPHSLASTRSPRSLASGCAGAAQQRRRRARGQGRLPRARDLRALRRQRRVRRGERWQRAGGRRRPHPRTGSRAAGESPRASSRRWEAYVQLQLTPSSLECPLPTPHLSPSARHPSWPA